MDAWNGYWQPEPESEFEPVEAQLSTRPTKHSRTAERIGIEFGAALRQRGASGVTVQIMDVSTHGFRVATHLELPPGTDVWLRLPGLEPCHARAVWRQGHYVGCEFVRPLHPAVLQMVVRKAGR